MSKERERSKRFYGSLNSREKLNQGKFNRKKKKKLAFYYVPSISIRCYIFIPTLIEINLFQIFNLEQTH